MSLKGDKLVRCYFVVDGLNHKSLSSLLNLLKISLCPGIKRYNFFLVLLFYKYDDIKSFSEISCRRIFDNGLQRNWAFRKCK